MPKIAIVTGAHLCRNPRVIKEAAALWEAVMSWWRWGPPGTTRLPNSALSSTV